MMLLDVNVFVYAFAASADPTGRVAEWLAGEVDAGARIALWEPVPVGFIRVVTNQRAFQPITSADAAIDFVERLAALPNAEWVSPGPTYWGILRTVIREAGVSGADVSDAMLAALAIEHDLTLVSLDRDFARYPGLTWRLPG